MGIIIGGTIITPKETDVKKQFQGLFKQRKEVFEQLMYDRISGKVFTEEPGGTMYTQSGIDDKMMENLYNNEYQMAARRNSI